MCGECMVSGGSAHSFASMSLLRVTAGFLSSWSSYRMFQLAPTHSCPSSAAIPESFFTRVFFSCPLSIRARNGARRFRFDLFPVCFTVRTVRMAAAFHVTLFVVERGTVMCQSKNYNDTQFNPAITNVKGVNNLSFTVEPRSSNPLLSVSRL